MVAVTILNRTVCSRATICCVFFCLSCFYVLGNINYEGKTVKCLSVLDQEPSFKKKETVPGDNMNAIYFSGHRIFFFFCLYPTLFENLKIIGY